MLAKSKKVYRAELKRFMAFLGREGELDTTFSPNQLLGVMPNDVARYLNQKAFRTEEPTDEDLPIYARSNTLKAMKKQLSVFMPRQNIQWDSIRKEGNPTKAAEVNDVIKRVMKFEVRRQGVASQARRPVEFAEFINVYLR